MTREHGGAERILVPDNPYRPCYRDKAWNEQGIWPARWIGCAGAGPPPFVTAFRRKFSLEVAAVIRVHVTADERYDLWLDGERIGRGSERGDANCWFFETYDLHLQPGEHIIVARTWSLGVLAPYAQMSVYPGFLLSPQEPEWLDRLGTGAADWEAKKLGGYQFTDPTAAWGTGANVIVEGSRFDWGFELGVGSGWEAAVPLGYGLDTHDSNDCPPAHMLQSAVLPAMMERVCAPGRVRLAAAIAAAETHAIPIREADDLPDERQAWNRLWAGQGNLLIPPNTIRRVLLDLADYYCAYPELVVSGGAGSSIRIHWQEALFDAVDSESKGNRDEIEGKYFMTIWWRQDGIGDTFHPDGGAHRLFETLWWQCGRYLEVVVRTADEPLTIETFRLRETRYPLEMESEFQSSDERLQDVTPIAVRALQMCSHETYMDCPYYEQLMYVGDTRLQALTTYVLTADDRLPRKALRMFDLSRLPSNITQSRYPTRVRQVTPPFSLWWIAMLHDHALWRGNLPFLQERMPGARAVLDAFRGWMNADGLIERPPGWNFIDWATEWDSGMPPGGHSGVTACLNWQFVGALRQAAELEEWLDEPELALRHRKLAARLCASMDAVFWDEERGLFADDRLRQNFSEHAQCLALLYGELSPERRNRVAWGLLNDPGLVRTTIYFTHYLFEGYRLVGRMDRFFERMEGWFDLKRQGFKTTVEMPEPSRSDCHAWGAHPLYHYFASLLGIRPTAPGFSQVEIRPQPGPLSWLRGTLPHPLGEIRVDLKLVQGKLTGAIELPMDLTGIYTYDGQEMALRGGRQQVSG